MYSEEDGKRFLRLARHALETFYSNEGLNLTTFKDYEKKDSVFINILRRSTEVVGCTAFIDEGMPIYRAIVKAARKAAFNNPRCAPLSESDIKNVKISISIIHNLELVRVMNPEDYVNKIVAGVDGIMVKAGAYSAVIMPHISERYFWDVPRTLQYLCQLAGLTMDAWKNPNIAIYKFQAETFTETDEGVIKEA